MSDIKATTFRLESVTQAFFKSLKDLTYLLLGFAIQAVLQPGVVQVVGAQFVQVVVVVLLVGKGGAGGATGVQVGLVQGAGLAVGLLEAGFL